MLKKYYIIPALAITGLLVLSGLSWAPFPSEDLKPAIKPEHLACTQDTDCATIATSCACLCKAGLSYVAVARQFREQYSELGHCSASELRQCATLGACGITAPKAACEAGTCKVVR